ncbi:hypothetical protein NDU88_002024 [Pleurodeles waltl]|uniref:Uncharacterized protein n=1 Tax=Pleurodeles waltl TaxID=8319 RepID=A0AAV7Q5D8_PLEWA|nr:hypothetical protein NDU88_002024 [Pleurodeles waltl]
MLLACSRRKEAGRKPPIGSMRVRTHGQQKRTVSSERASARFHGLLPLHMVGNITHSLMALRRNGAPDR